MTGKQPVEPPQQPAAATTTVKHLSNNKIAEARALLVEINTGKDADGETVNLRYVSTQRSIVAYVAYLESALDVAVARADESERRREREVASWAKMLYEESQRLDRERQRADAAERKVLEWHTAGPGWVQNDALRANLARVEAQRARLELALHAIRDTYGQVCDEYELCTHRSCQSSYGAWATADEALAEPAAAPDDADAG